MSASTAETLQLLDWKRRIFGLYAEVRAATDAAMACAHWQATRCELFAKHPQSPIPAVERDAYEGPHHFPHDPAVRVKAEVIEIESQVLEGPSSGPEPFRMTRFAEARFSLYGESRSLDLHWLEGYGGGLFVPFTDATSGHESYGGGRYLLDTVKGSDLGMAGGRLVLDFNLAYQPSCSYDPRWACPLAPPGNRLDVRVEAGERLASAT